jgi:acetyl esterase/lipase
MPIRCRRTCAILTIACFAFVTGCTKFDLLNSTVPTWGYSRTSNISYGSLPQQKLDVYQPCHSAPGTRVVIFFYGGDWQAGSKDDYRFAAQAFVSKGFVTVMPNYRLYPSVTFPAFIQDGAQAIKWVHDNIARFNGDPTHVYVAGHSAGAHIAALLTLDGRYLQAVGLDRSAIHATLALSGPYDFVPSQDDLPVFSMKPNDTSPDPNIEPIHFVDGKEPPMLLIHGSADETVDRSNASRLAAQIRAAGGKVRYIRYQGLGHVGVVLSLAFPFRCIAPVLRDCADYINND